jgi:hypothetical protein
VAHHWIESSNLSHAWARALYVANKEPSKEVVPLVVSIAGFSQSNDFQEDANIRAELDKYLAATGRQSVQTVASTIFPTSLWNQSAPRSAVFSRYERLLPRLLKASPKNRRGLYFERMITGGPKGKENQLEFGMSAYLARKAVRRSILQVGVFQPGRDHSRAAMLGFPCLQHVTFAPSSHGLSVNAFYATHYLVERAYGNYVGLCALGKFVAHELKLPLDRVTCFAGIAEFETSRSGMARLLKRVATHVDGS